MIKQIKDKLYLTNEYDVVYQDPLARLNQDEIDWMVNEWEINDDVHRMCVNCQARQVIKYIENPTGDDAFEPGKFYVDCNFVAKGLPPGTRQHVKRLALKNDITEEEALLLVRANMDPVAWAEVMFGFRDEDPKKHLRSYQKEQMRCTSTKMVIREGRRAGKALPLDTPIPTPRGWTTMGELKEGDAVFSDAGTPTRVTFVTDTMHGHDCYKLSFDDGTTMIADAEHQWTVSTRSSRRRYKQGTLQSPDVVVQTQDMLGHIKIGKKHPENNFRIELCKPVEYTLQLPVHIDAYVLGYWLGDGVRNTSRITVGLEDQAEALKSFRDAGYEVREGGYSEIDHCLYGLVTQLKEYGVDQDKRIPRDYFLQASQTRWELLKGLMDSDGSADEQGRCEFTTTDTGLADDFEELATGLGLKVTRTTGESWFNGARYKDRIRFYFNTYEPVFRLSRKLNRQMRPGRTIRDYRAIISIEPVASVPVRCITVDSPRSLYLAGRQHLVTHNTFAMALKMIYLALNLLVDGGTDKETGKKIYSGPQIMIVTPYQSQISNIFNEMEKILKMNRSGDLMQAITTAKSGSLYVKTPFFRMEFENGAKISGFVSGVGTSSDGSGGGTMRGQNADVIYMDEMDMIPEEVLDKVIVPILLTRDDVIMIATSTPIGKRGAFYKWCLQDPTFKEDYLPSSVLPQWAKQERFVRAENTEESFRAEYMAEFVDGDFGVFKASLVYDARANYEYKETYVNSPFWREKAGVPESAQLRTVVGIDWNKNAGTEYVVVAYDGNSGRWFVVEATNVPHSEFSSISWKEEVIRLNYKWKPDYIYADAGYGHTIIEDLKLHAHNLRQKQSRNHEEQQTVQLTERLIAFDFKKKVDLRSPVDGQVMSKEGKQFLVENAIRVFEDRKIWFPERDKKMMMQLLNYRVLRRSVTTNKPVYGAESERTGDHRLDALILALGGLTLEFSVYAKGQLPTSSPHFLSKDEMAMGEAGWMDPREQAGRISNAFQQGGASVSVLSIIRGHQGEPIEVDRMVKEKLAAQNQRVHGRADRGDMRRRGKRGVLGSEEAPKSVFEEMRARASSSEGFERDEEMLYTAREMGGGQAVGRRKRPSSRRRGFTRKRKK